MIRRIWHGWTIRENADKYETLLRREIFPEIVYKKLNGLLGIEAARRELDFETEFMTIMTFQSLEDIVIFLGEDYTRCYVPDSAQKLLNRWNEHAVHYQVVEQRTYQVR